MKPKTAYTAAEYQAEIKGKPPAKKSKMGNLPEEYNGRTYQSKKEATRAQHLDWMVQRGEIKHWEAQVPFKIEIRGILICTYVLDFLVTLPDGTLRYEDVKGRRAGAAYQMFLVKKHLMRAVLDIEVIEV